MRKLLLAVLLWPLVSYAQQDNWDFNETINQTNFIVENRCSGTLVSLEHKLILTNYHCIPHKVGSFKTEKVVDGEIVEVEKERLLPVTVSQKRYGKVPGEAGLSEVGEAEYKSEIVAKEKKKDLALLKLLADDIPHSTYSQVLPVGMNVKRGDVAFHVGNPAMLDATMTKGIISSVTRTMRVRWAEGERVPFIQYDGGAFPGSSGGAIYNEHGYLIGNVTTGYDSTLVMAIHPDLIRKFLKEACWPVYLGGELKPKGEEGEWYCKDWGKREIAKSDRKD